MRCEEIMKRDVECLQPNDTAQQAAVKMRNENIGFLPVCDDTGKVLGTLTDRDIAIRLVAQGKSPTTVVSDILTREAVTCRPSDDIRDAERLLAERKKSRIMCVDDAGHLVGVISLSDIAQAEEGVQVAATLREVTAREAA